MSTENTDGTEVTIRPVCAEDHDGWRTLYRGYRDFYKMPHSDAAIDTVWSWLHDHHHETRGLIALAGELPVGLAHYRTFARPLSASHGIYLDDLFTSPEARGHGVGGALLARLSEIARDEGATVVRWITAGDNETARRLYDRVAAETPWVTYDLAPAASD